MEKLIMIKYGELSTKKGNIGFFLNTLKNNIVSVLDGLNYELKHDKSRMFIEVDDLNEAVSNINSIPRKKFNYSSPLELARKMYPTRLLALNNLHFKSLNEINLTPKKK